MGVQRLGGHHNKLKDARRCKARDAGGRPEREADTANKESVSRKVSAEGSPADPERSDVTSPLKTQQWLSILFPSSLSCLHASPLLMRLLRRLYLREIRRDFKRNES